MELSIFEEGLSKEFSFDLGWISKRAFEDIKLLENLHEVVISPQNFLFAGKRFNCLDMTKIFFDKEKFKVFLQTSLLERSIIQHQKASCSCFHTFFPNISITDPVLSSLAGRNPPNPVVAVTSGIIVMELDPLSLSVRRDLLRILLVMSGMVFLLLKFNSDFPMEESFEDLKLNEGTDALGTLLTEPPGGPFATLIVLFSLD